MLGIFAQSFMTAARAAPLRDESAGRERPRLRAPQSAVDPAEAPVPGRGPQCRT
jgi:hypothetical protein